MEENKKNKVPNVPNLRFGESVYLPLKIRDICSVISGGTPDTSNPDFWDGDINWFTPSEVGTRKYVETSKRKITQNGYRSCGAKMMASGSILLTSRATIGDESICTTDCCTNQGFQSLTNFKCNKQYLYYYLQSYRIHKSLVRRASGSTFLEISNYEVGNTRLFIPNDETQYKVSSLLSKIDERIETQNKIIEELETYKNAIENIIFKSSYFSTFYIGDLCKITTGKLDANAAVPNGIYRFYTCAANYTFIDNYAFDCDAVLISGNGANVGYVHQYNGKFNAYQRTYVLYNFSKISSTYLRFFLEKNLKQRINSEKNNGNTPYIRLETISKMKIGVPDQEKQNLIVNALLSITEKIDNEKRLLKNFYDQKKFLLSNLFI